MPGENSNANKWDKKCPAFDSSNTSFKLLQATTAIVEKTVRAFYSTIAVVSTITVVCCREYIFTSPDISLLISDISSFRGFKTMSVNQN